MSKHTVTEALRTQSLGSLTRRHWLIGASATTLLGASRGRQVQGQRPQEQTRVAVIGATGRGNYGHGLDVLWKQLPETSIVAVADDNAVGLANAKKRLGVDAGYADYEQMLKREAPDVVAVCPRHPDQHCDMMLAAMDAGAKGIYVEKPFVRTLAEADKVMQRANKRGTKIAVAHRNRYHPALQTIRRMIEAGEIGKLLEIRGRGKGDRRGGGEDLWVLGSHVLNLVHFFGGQPKSCSAVLMQQGVSATAKDIRDGGDAIGLLAGNELHARYVMEQGVIAYFDSIANDQTKNFGFGLQLVGSEGVIAILCDRNPLAYVRRGNPLEPSSKPQPWLPISTAGVDKPEPIAELNNLVGKHIYPAKDLLAAISENRAPLCSGDEGKTTVEMISGVFASHVAGGAAVDIPLENRNHPLADWSDANDSNS